MSNRMPALFSADYLNGRPQDMRLHLNTPQLNRLRYLIGLEVGNYVPAADHPEFVAEYEVERDYLLVTDDVREDAPTIVVNGKPKRVLRAAYDHEADMVLDLKAQLDNLWAGNDRVTGDYNHRNIESITSDGPLCEECGEEEHTTDQCPHLQAMVDSDYPDGVYIQEGYKVSNPNEWSPAPISDGNPVGGASDDQGLRHHHQARTRGARGRVPRLRSLQIEGYERVRKARYDSNSKFGGSMNLCSEHFRFYGRGTGLGVGQRLIKRPTS